MLDAKDKEDKEDKENYTIHILVSPLPWPTIIFQPMLNCLVED
jgi:hypothetical protein